MTLWYPLTCDCSLEFEMRKGAMFCTEIKNACDLHKDIEDPQLFLAAIIAHQQVVNAENEAANAAEIGGEHDGL